MVPHRRKAAVSRNHGETAVSAYSKACRDCAFGLLRTAREYRAMGNEREVARLVNASRFYWRMYKQEIAQ